MDRLPRDGNGSPETAESSQTPGSPLHMHWPITVASFRTWRGSQDYIARDPAPDIFDIIIRDSSESARQVFESTSKLRCDTRNSSPRKLILRVTESDAMWHPIRLSIRTAGLDGRD